MEGIVGGAVQHAFRGVPAGRGILRARPTNTNVGTACACVSTMQGDVLVGAARSCNSKMIGSACQVVPRCRSGLTDEHPPRAGQAARLGVPGPSGAGCGANVDKMRAKVLDQGWRRVHRQHTILLHACARASTFASGAHVSGCAAAAAARCMLLRRQNTERRRLLSPRPPRRRSTPALPSSRRAHNARSVPVEHLHGQLRDGISGLQGCRGDEPN